ncbi:MAG: outer membrane beta-barrel protein, partial [Porphyrobacter sp.]|nr:outer membrane beta-barrel protein [Porphyrobacter sp.]
MNHSFKQVRRLALAAGVAAVALAVPAQARDGEGYVGIDAGLVLPQHTDIDVSTVENAIVVDNKKGFDIDAVIGYDWGILRTEAELGRKQFGVKSIVASEPAGTFALPNGAYDAADGKTKVTTAMANALLDFGGNGGVGFSIGVGAGRAWANTHLAATDSSANFLDDKDSAWAWQGVAQLRVPVSDRFEIGLKYKYLNTHPFVMTDAVGRTNQFDISSHSI